MKSKSFASYVVVFVILGMSKTRHGLCIFVENEFGVIQRVTNLFSARGISIDSIHTTPVDVAANVSQISISLLEDATKVELIQKLLMKLLIVHEVRHIEIPMMERSPYASQVFHVHQNYLTKVREVINEYDLTCFNIYSNPKIHCITGTQQVVEAFIKQIKDIPSLVLVKQYSPF